MTLLARGKLVLWMIGAVLAGLLAGRPLGLAIGFVGARLGMGAEAVGLTVLWTTRIGGLVGVWIGANRAQRRWPGVSPRRMAIVAIAGIVTGMLLGHAVGSVIGESYNRLAALAVLGYGAGAWIGSSSGPRHA